jgi:hypothetical protein
LQRLVRAGNMPALRFLDGEYDDIDDDKEECA